MGKMLQAIYPRSNIPFIWLQSFSSKPCPLPCENNGLVPVFVNTVTLNAHLAAILTGVHGGDSAWYGNKYVKVGPKGLIANAQWVC